VIQTTLDQKKPFGYVIGKMVVEGQNVKYQQNGLDFNHKHERLTPYTDEEKTGLEKKPEKKVIETGAPDMQRWGKAAVLNHMKMQFPDTDIDKTMETAALKEQCLALYRSR
jgi:hypothetical protein